jgi:hypothetical protein
LPRGKLYIPYYPLICKAMFMSTIDIRN